MKIYKLLAIFLIAFLFANCSKDETPAPEPDTEEQPDSDPKPEEPISEVYYKLNVLSSSGSSIIDYWVILHNDRKELLDYKKFEIGDSLVFESNGDSVTENISVTFMLFRQDQNGNIDYRLSSDLDIPKGTEKNFGFIGGSNNPALEKTGDFNVSIAGIPSLEKINITNQSGLHYESFAQFSGINPYNFDESISKYEGFNDYFISILDGNNELKYLDFKNEGGTDVTFNYADFKLFDTYHNITLPDYNSYYLYVAGHDDVNDEAPSFWLHSIWSNLDSNIQTNPLKYGYLDKFAKNTTAFNIKMDGYDYSIVREGDKLENIVIPLKPNLIWQNESVHEFDFTSDISFLKASHHWSSSIGESSQNNLVFTSWQIDHEAGTKPNIAPLLPMEIIEKYPDLNIDSLNYDKSTLTTKDDKGLNYDYETISIFNQ